jgi:hypothetical protein
MSELTPAQEKAIQYINDAPNTEERKIRKMDMFFILYASNPALTSSSLGLYELASTLHAAKKDDNTPAR